MAQADKRSVGIIGAGRLGQCDGTDRASRGPARRHRQQPRPAVAHVVVVDALGEGVTAGTVEDASAADIIVLAVMWADVPQAIEGLEWQGRIVIDPTNDFDASDLDGRTSSEVVADLVTPARVVKAANTLGAPYSLPTPSGGWSAGDLPVRDDEDAKSEVVTLFEEAGFFRR